MTLRLDLSNRTFTAEVIRSRSIGSAVDAIGRLLQGPQTRFKLTMEEASVDVLHGFFASPIPYHRTTRDVVTANEETIRVPREKTIRNKTHFLYDVVVINNKDYAVVAVPFHGIAEDFFVKVDKTLAGTRGVYETLNITKMVMELDAKTKFGKGNGRRTIGVTRCQLAYSDPEHRSTNLQQIRLVGSDLRESQIYTELTEPVRSPERSEFTVTPIVLGFALFENGVRRASAITDRHGNFKLWIGTTVDRTARVLSLLDQVALMSGVRGTTNNLPILQSRTIREEEGA